MTTLELLLIIQPLMLIRVLHGINPSPSALESLCSLLLRPASIWHSLSSLNRISLANFLRPFLQGWELREVNLQK